MKKLFTLVICFSLIFSFLPGGVKAQSDIEEEIIYNILVDRYNVGEQAKSDQVRTDDPYAYQGGDLKGITANLNEIQTLGYTAISLSPIMENAEDGYHGYWIDDHFQVEEQFGTMEDLHKLVEEAHERDINVYLELVTNYVDQNHPFTQDEEHKGWFQANDVTPTESTFWLEDVAVLDQDNPEVVDYLIDVADFWMDEVDIDGFNLHAVDQTSELFLTELVDHVSDKDPTFALIANIIDEDAPIDHVQEHSDVIALENYDLYEAITDVFSETGKPVSDIYSTWEETGDERNLLFVDNEHTARFPQTVLENGRNTVTAWKLALTYLYTTPGVPFVFQGSELTMYGEGFPDTQRLVPFHSGDPEVDQFFERISSLKKEFAPLSYGSFEQIATDGAMSVFERTYEDETLYIAINNDDETRTVTVTDIDSNKRLRGLLADNLSRQNDDGSYTIGIPRESVEVYMIEEDTGFNWWFIGFVISVFFIFVFAVIYLSRKQKARST